MQRHLVITITGPDRTGLVEQISKLLLEHGGNVESSRMARLGGEFAIVMLVAAPAQNFEALRETVRALREAGYRVTTRKTERGHSAKYAGWLPYEVQVHGADHEGIIHEVTRNLAHFGINIETMDTEMTNAPMSGTPLFSMTALVFAPPDIAQQDWREELIAAGDQLNVDIDIARYSA